MAAANHELARSDYLAGMTYKDIAAKYSVSINTVKSWANRHKWRSSRRVQRPRGAPEADAAMIASVEENDTLTDAEREFCLRYIRSFNAVRSHMGAFGSTWENANAHAYRLLQKDNIIREIRKLKEIKNAAILASGEDVVEMYMRIAFADLRDFVSWGRTSVPVMGPFGPITVTNENGEQVGLYKEINDVQFVDSNAADGQIVTEVKVGRDGASIKLADRMAALKWLSDYFELNPRDRHRNEYDRRRLELEERKLEKLEAATSYKPDIAADPLSAAIENTEEQ